MTTVLISGASVAGPALAYWLQRYGFTTTVVERAPAPRAGGYAVDFRGASMKVLERMGILDAVRAKATDMGDITYVNEQGKRVASTPPSALSGELEILRGDLVEILYSRTADTTEYLFGDSIASLTDDGSGVDVVFESGLTRRFDLVIGADGQHSNVRRIAFGPESSYTHDLGYYVSVSTVANHLNLDHTGQILNVPARPSARTAHATTPRRRRCSTSPPRTSWTTTGATRNPRRRSSTSSSPASAGRCRRYWRGCGRRQTSTSTRSPRSSWTATPVAEWRWSATPGTAPRRCQAWARVSRSWARTSSPVSCTRPTATTCEPSRSTTYA
ncbi:FAD-dependent monooxygenase [Kribbella sp. CA-245084]|uniref:FAD-dependent monooxygenase n=1 Tax=Kribbella sp. CA-245084 TaxID=3239940 RepID=UPI003D8E2838